MTDDVERLSRMRIRAEIKRATAVSSIQAVHALAVRAATEPAVVSSFLASVNDLDTFWSQFKAEDDSVLECLIALNLHTNYSSELQPEVRAIINECRARADNFSKSGTGSFEGGAYLAQSDTKDPVASEIDYQRPLSRLPEIPLPRFDGNAQYWPTFRDRFHALVDSRSNLSNVEKFYYLLGCLDGPAADAVRRIPVSADNYKLAMSTLSTRFHRPRLVATSLIEQILRVPVANQESVSELNIVLSIFNENISLLNALNVPDLGSFILFILAFRSLPVTTRKMFESTVTSDYPTIVELLEFVQSRVSILELAGDNRKQQISVSHNPSSNVSHKGKTGGEGFRRNEVRRPTALVSTGPNISCPCCQGNHVVPSCARFKSWAVDERSRWTRTQGLCLLCFSADHWANKCTTKFRCNSCSRNHHTLLHPSGPARNTARSVSPSPPAALCTSTSVSTLSTRAQPASPVLLGTALIHIRDRSGSWQVMRALVDCASEISAMTVACADRLNLKRTRWTNPVAGLSGVPVTNVRGIVNCSIQPRFANEFGLSVKAWVLPSITGNLPRATVPASIRDRFSNIALADPEFHVSSPVDLLLGGDVYSTIMDGRKFVIDDSLPSAFSSIFGWILMGPVSQSDVSPRYSLPVSLTVSIEGLVEHFWQVEEPDAAPASFTDNGQCEEIFHTQHFRLPSGRFSVPLPFRSKVTSETFSGSRDMAIRRFESLERKLLANQKLKSLYKDFMSEYIELGHMSVATSPGSYFIPHHAVYRSDDGNSKLRVVFDASARGFHTPSLNSCLFQGPKLQQDIIDVLMRFRIHPYVFTADICKMYRQILVNPEHRQFQHIFWRSSPHEALVEYELNTVTYGVNCAPFLALRVLQAIAANDCAGAEVVRHALTCQTYVDDVCVGADSVEEALDLQTRLILTLGKSMLELKKWSSNTSAILDAVPAASRKTGPLPFDAVEEMGTKVLGLEWQPQGDHLGCALKFNDPPVYTKRGVLSLVARIFDPLGLFGPTTFFAKSIMQRTWACGLTWDDPLPDDIRQEWSSFISELRHITVVRVPRHFGTRTGTPCHLLGFGDASQRGYAAVVYICTVGVHGEHIVSLIGTKTKLAPLKPLTIPRLELNAALLLARWLHRIKTTLEPQLNILGTHAWTDSTIVLSWLTIPHECFKQYVSNRVHQIRFLLPNCQWRHVDSAENPADCASRGVRPSELVRLDLYWHGPPFVYNDSSSWPIGPRPIPLSELPETSPVSLTTGVSDVPTEWFTRFSGFDHMLRVVAYMKRFVDRTARRQLFDPTLGRVEIDAAERVIILEAQKHPFSVLRNELERGDRISAKYLARLCPFIDPDGIIRVGGRLRHSKLPYEQKHPVLLPKSSHLSVLLCFRWHKITCHSGPRVMSSLINRRYWIIALRSVIRAVVGQCTTCVRFNASRPQPVMADLPSSRVHECRAFQRVGVDYAGPLQMRDLHLRKSRSYKVYMAIFVCFAVKAVHLELVTDLSTEAFLAAFDRFVARRGLPSDVHSDCGTNFIGAAKQLRQLVNSQASIDHIAAKSHSCVWHFNPPGAPHFGGLWEAAVRSAKRLLFRVMGTHTFSYEEMTTVLCRVEAVLNSRPLTPLSTDPHDLDCLTPGHFLIGQPLLAVPPRVNIDTGRTIVNRWKLLDQCHQSFWRRWSNEYLYTLQTRTKWSTSQPNVRVNDLLLIRDPNLPPLEWRLGRVVEVCPGPDGVVRVVRLHTTLGLVTRPVIKLVPLLANQPAASTTL